jgi:hypothetical protein
MSHRTFRAGLVSLAVGQGLLVCSLLLGQHSIQLVDILVIVGAVLSGLGAAILSYLTAVEPDQFEFSGSTPRRHAPTAVLIGGVLMILAGAVNLAVALLG